MFRAGDQEVLMVGLHPQRGQVAVRNSVFQRGREQWGFKWVSADFPSRNQVGERSYIFEFNERDFLIWCSGEVSLFLSEVI